MKFGEMLFCPPPTTGTVRIELQRNDLSSGPLPERDEVPCIISSPGIYDARREGTTVASRLEFLEQVKARWGSDAAVSFVGSYDGYPAYISVKPREQKELFSK